MKIQGVMATTHVDRHGMRFTKDALESGAAVVNGPRKPTIGLEHDRTIPPLGKLLTAWIEVGDDGEYRLMNVGELFEKFQMTVLPDGMTLLKQECETDRNPFVMNDELSIDGFSLAYDRMNFADEETLDSFLKEVRAGSSLSFDEAEFYRKSLIPDPEIIIRLSSALATVFVARKVLDRVADKAGELIAQDLVEFHSFVETVARAATKCMRPKDQPITYVFELAGEPFVEFIVRSSDAEVVVSGLVPDKLEPALAKAEELTNHFGAERIQFLLNDDCTWELSYLLTADGAVIGTEKSFRRRDRRISLMRSTAESGGVHAAEGHSGVA